MKTTGAAAYQLPNVSAWLGRGAPQRFAFALVIGIATAALHWAMFPWLQGRISFLLFPPAILIVTTIAGRWPGVFVASIGLANSALQKAPIGSLLIASEADQLSMLASVVVAISLIAVGDFFRTRSRRELKDLHDLHELSTTLASISRLEDQLRLILQTLTHMHGTVRGLLCTFDPERNRLQVASHLGLSEAALAQFAAQPNGATACAIACTTRERVIIADTEADPLFASMRDLARAEGFRAVHSTPLLSRDGEVLGVISVQLSSPRRPTEREIRLADICARKAVVFIERARAEDRARLRDQQFRVVLDASGVPFSLLAPARDASGKIQDFRWLYLNAAASARMGVEGSSLIGKCIGDVLPGAWAQPGVWEEYVAALEKNATREFELQFTVGVDGWFHVIVSPFEGNIAVWSAEITDRKRQEEMLRVADRRKDEFLATLAHELRNPLAPIRQAAMIARSEGATEAQKRWSHNVIERQVQHMSLLLEDLLDVSRITHGTLQLRRQITDLLSVVSAAIETARPLIDERQHRLNVEVPDDIRVYGDPLRLAQVFSNLLTNAAKYTHPRGAIRVSAQQHEDQLIVAVEDNGIGIAAEDLPAVFGMFSQLRAAEEHSAGGLGIGLALTKGLVELHGGRVEVFSAGRGRGSRFTVRMPAAVVSAAPLTVPRERRDDRITGKKRILLADDNHDAAESLAMLLRLEGHDVFVAHDGEAAWTEFQRLEPDVVLLDIGMPLRSGYEVARSIRGHRRGADTLLIAITGWAQDSDRERTRAAGFDHHLTKPIEPDALADLLGPKSARSAYTA
jgi:signal transduction histidine kinase/CheY-like chemotaxis protein